MHFGGLELVALLLLVLLLFGPGRIGKIAGELGQGIKNFKDELSGKKEEKTDTTEPAKAEETKEEKK